MKWSCPFCNRAQVVTPDARDSITSTLLCEDFKQSGVQFTLFAIRCAACDKVTMTMSYSEAKKAVVEKRLLVSTIGEVTQRRVIPPSSAKPQPAFIPHVLIDDYQEACLIRDLSPKASATLSRRCLQGMIRHFCGIVKDTLYQEISALRHQLDQGQAPAGVTSETVDAIDQVRLVGNIGAHMDKDINLIIEVEPNEAQLMIELIEMLFEEWYVARHRREARLAQIKATAEAKQHAKKPMAKAPEAAASGQ